MSSVDLDSPISQDALKVMDTLKSRNLKMHLRQFVWPDGTRRWDPTRAGCYHCGSTDRVSPRHLCLRCRRETFFVPTNATSPNPFVKVGGYKFCQRNCRTVPLPLDCFPEGQHKCFKCFRSRMKSLRAKQQRMAAMTPDAGSGGSGSTSPPSSLDARLPMTPLKTPTGAGTPPPSMASPRVVATTMDSAPVMYPGWKPMHMPWSLAPQLTAVSPYQVYAPPHALPHHHPHHPQHHHVPPAPVAVVYHPPAPGQGPPPAPVHVPMHTQWQPPVSSVAYAAPHPPKAADTPAPATSCAPPTGLDALACLAAASPCL